MNSIPELFKDCVKYVNNNKQLSENVTDEDALELYGMYKQSTLGDNTLECPGVFSYVSRKKWESWYGYKGIKKHVAKKLYCKKVQSLIK